MALIRLSEIAPPPLTLEEQRAAREARAAAYHRDLSRILTWGALVKLEPRLQALRRDVRAHAAEQRAEGRALHPDTPCNADDPCHADRWCEAHRYCANHWWYGRGGFRARMRMLVGWEAKGDGIIRSMAAYDVAYATLHGDLPDCRHERGGCW